MLYCIVANVLQYKIDIIIAIIVYHEKSRKFVESFLLEETILQEFFNNNKID